ncbi:indole-3-glycerol phosphate synthase TrpC [Alphaproteobacteria bacterium]|nr:indole-3-glycerol phosphate synthase TrpC [Alphaproteobacteria bacterium]
MNILDKIVGEQKNKLEYLEQKYKFKKRIKINSKFIKNIETNNLNEKTSIIAEFKRYSPSVEKFKKIKHIGQIINQYELSSVTCISILTDKNFGGSLNDIKIAKKFTNKPIIRKDFILDKIQIYESALFGTDAILLIARILTEEKLLKLEEYAHYLGLDVLIEIESKKDLSKIRNTKTKLIGINNRNLALQTIDITKTINLSSKIKEKIIVSESGLTVKNINLIKEKNINTFLIGGSILDNKNIKNYISDINKQS